MTLDLAIVNQYFIWRCQYLLRLASVLVTGQIRNEKDCRFQNNLLM